MFALAIALALLAQDAPPPADAPAPAPAEAAPPPADAPAGEAAPPEPPRPAGAPTDDYGFVAWCYGALGGYLDLYDRVIPEVTRIEGAYQKPGESLSEDMKTYSDMRTEGRRDMKLFARAIQAAEKASMQPISARGAAAIQKGRSSWAPAGNLSDRMVAQQWMGWTLPERCVSTAASLEKRAKLLGATFRSEEPQPDPAVSEAPPPEAPPPESIPAEPAQPTQTPVEPPPTFS